MFHYWTTIVKILWRKNFQDAIGIDQTIQHDFRVRTLDCDGLRVMAATRYPVYMDFIRWELIARSKLLGIARKHGLAPSLGSQKIIYRKPLKRGSKFTLELEFGGIDDKWVFHIHRFIQQGEVKAIGITRALFWKKDVSIPMKQILKEAGYTKHHPPEAWVLRLFESDKSILEHKILKA